MADEKRVVRTAGISGTLRMPGLLETDDGPADLDITPEGVEVTQAQWEKIAEAATANHVVVRLDEDFPVVVAEESAPETAGTPTPDGASGNTKTEEPATTDTGLVPPSTGGTSSRKGR